MEFKASTAVHPHGLSIVSARQFIAEHQRRHPTVCKEIRTMGVNFKKKESDQKEPKRHSVVL